MRLTNITNHELSELVKFSINVSTDQSTPLLTDNEVREILYGMNFNATGPINVSKDAHNT